MQTSQGWTYYGTEDARESCNGNGVYLGKVYDDVLTNDGSCVYVEFLDGSYQGTQGYSCDADGRNYSFWDQTGNTSAYYRLYLNYYTPPSSTFRRVHGY